MRLEIVLKDDAVKVLSAEAEKAKMDLGKYIASKIASRPAAVDSDKVKYMAQRDKGGGYGHPDLARAYPEEVLKTIPWELKLPVGDLAFIGGSQDVSDPRNWVEMPWYIPPWNKDKLIQAAKHWTENGFKLYITEPLKCDYAMVSNWQIGVKQPAADMTPALEGFVGVYMMIDEPEKALDHLQYYSDVPCALSVDVVKYNADGQYRQAAELWHRYFVEWYKNGEQAAPVAVR